MGGVYLLSLLNISMTILTILALIIDPGAVLDSETEIRHGRGDFPDS